MNSNCDADRRAGISPPSRTRHLFAGINLRSWKETNAEPHATRSRKRMGHGTPLTVALCASLWFAVSPGMATGGQWNPSQKSKPVRLEQGKKYYLEAVHKQNTGGANLAVGWIAPGGSAATVIKGAYFSPFPNGAKGTIRYEIWLNQATWPERR